MVQIGRGEAALLDKGARDACRQYAAPWMSDEEFIHWSIRHVYSFFSASAWMEYLRRFDFVIGTRIHGVMLALQAGIPALCLAHDSRTVELCETMVVPYVIAQEFAYGITRNDLPTLFKFDYEKFDNNRKILAKKYVEFLLANKMPCAQYLCDLSS